jgi:hypothetical protein
MKTHNKPSSKSVRRWWVLPSMVGKSGFYWNASDNQSPFRRLVRVYRKSETNIWVEDQNGYHSTIEGTGYYIGPYHPDSIVAAARKHPDYDMGQFSGKPPFSNGEQDPVVRAPANHAKPEDVTRIVSRGFQDALNGLDFLDNPFRSDAEDSGRYHAWFTGWFDAQDCCQHS